MSFSNAELNVPHPPRPGRYALILSLFTALCSVSCSDDAIQLGSGAVSVAVPRQTTLHCETLHHASTCNEYNVPGNNEGMEVLRCQGESANTRYLAVAGRHPEKFEPSSDESYLAGFVNAWSQCLDSHTQSSKAIEIAGNMGMEFVMRTPLGNGASRAFVENGYSIAVLAVPKHQGSTDEIQQFIAGMRAAKAK